MTDSRYVFTSFLHYIVIHCTNNVYNDSEVISDGLINLARV